MAFCPQCGTAVPEAATFCPRCGTRTGDEAAQAAAPLPVPAPVAVDLAASPVAAAKHTVVGLASPLLAPTPPVVAPPPEGARTEPVGPFPGAAVSLAATLAPAPAEPPLRNPKQTMLGMAAPLPNPSLASTQAVAPPATQFSVHDAPTSVPTKPAMNEGAGKRTMIGMSAADLGLLRPAGAPGADAPAPSGPVSGTAGTQLMPAYKGPAPAAAPAAAASAKKTMIGMASPLAPNGAKGAAAPAAAGPRLAKNGTVIGMASPLAGGGSHGAMGKTMPLGVYAPQPARKTLMGVPVPAFIAPQTEYVEEEYDEIVPETGQLERRVRVVAVPPPPLYKRPAVYVLLAALLIGTGGIAAVLFAPKNAPLRGEARVDGNGNDLLHVTCEACVDGTKISLPGGTPSEVKGHEVDLSVPAPLKVGENQVDVAIDRPGAGRDETLRLTVPIAYRIKPDLGPLQGPNPAIHILVEALPGSTATVLGAQVTLAADGKGTHVIDLRSELTGALGQPKQIDREVPYTIGIPGHSAETGKLSLRVGVPPLVLESPTTNMVTDAATFLVAGSTAKGAGISVAGHALSVDGQGRFSQLMNISSEGTTDAEIRATAPPLAPRLVKIHVRRVASLAAEAKQREAQAKTTYADVVAAGAAGAGKAVLWKANILEIAQSGAQKIAVLDVSTGCAKKPCLARVAMQGSTQLAKGDALTVAGNVIGQVSVRGAEVPDLEAEFVVKGP